MDIIDYEEMLRDRITKLRMEKNVAEYRMSLDLGKSGSYIRNITSGTAFPSFKELLNIIDYFGMTPAEFFRPFTDKEEKTAEIKKVISEMSSENVAQSIEWLN